MAFVAPLVPLITAGSALVGAAATVAGGIAQGNAASFQAQVAQNNAIIAKQNATYALEAGNAKEEQAGLRGAEAVGAAKTALAANNVDVNTGSALDVTTGTREKSELDQETVANNAELQAYGYNTEATGFESQAALDKATAAQAPIGADLAAVGTLANNAQVLPNANTLLNSASSLGFKWSGAQTGGGGIGSDYVASGGIG